MSEFAKGNFFCQLNLYMQLWNQTRQLRFRN